MNATLFLFQSTHDVIRAERLCLASALTVHVIPVPRDLSSECGMALEVDAAHAPRVRRLLVNERIATRAIGPEERGREHA